MDHIVTHPDNAKVIDIVFWWKFWEPFDCIGGPVRFGHVCEVEWAHEDGTISTNFQTLFQVEQKRQLGWIR